MINMYMGIAAQDLKPKTNELSVYIPEMIYDKSGLLDSTDGSVGRYINEGGDTDSKAEQGISVTATWCPLNTTRVTAPLIKKGMNVLLFKMGNTDRYQWLQMGSQLDLLGKDVVVNLYGNTDKFGTMLNGENSHSIVIDPLFSQSMYINTVDNDGEKAKYLIKLDLKNGTFILEDNHKNKIFLDSTKGELTVDTANSVSVTTKEYTVKADTILFDGKDITMKGSSITIDGATTVKGPSLEISTLSNFTQPVTMNSMAMIMGFGSPISHGGTIQ